MIQMKKILKRKNVVRTSKKLRLYNALVKSVLTYNSCTWGLTKQDEQGLDSFHRQQLRQVIGVFYPVAAWRPVPVWGTEQMSVWRPL